MVVTSAPRPPELRGEVLYGLAERERTGGIRPRRGAASVDGEVHAAAGGSAFSDAQANGKRPGERQRAGRPGARAAGEPRET